MPHALFVFSHEGTLILTNAAARRLCAEHPKLFQLRKHCLLIEGKSVAEFFGGPLASLRERSLLIRQPGASKSARQEFRLVLSRTGLRRTRDPVSITVYERFRPRQVAESVLQQFYDLTPSESATAAHLFRGLRPTQIAEALGISVNTVRSHAKRIFMKCHVRSQSELVRLLALGPGIE